MRDSDFGQKDFSKARYVKAVASAIHTRVLAVLLFDERTKIGSIRPLRRQLLSGLKWIFRYFAKFRIIFVGVLSFREVSNVLEEIEIQFDVNAVAGNLQIFEFAASHAYEAFVFAAGMLRVQA